jgi:integrase
MMSRVEQYLAHRRSLGSPLRTTAYPLQAFARFADEHAPGQPLTCLLAMRWIDSYTRDMRVTRNNRVAALRGLARFCQAIDARTEVPPLALLSPKPKRRAPHIFSDSQVRCLMQRTRHLRSSRARLRGMTMGTLIGLLACTGLRIGEALRLRFQDFDARAGMIHVSRTKYSPERDLPLHPSTVRALQRYQRTRWQQCRIASAKMLPNGLVASPEMLPVTAHATMMPSQTGRHHEAKNDACHARGVGRRDPRPLFSRRR